MKNDKWNRAWYRLYYRRTFCSTRINNGRAGDRGGGGGDGGTLLNGKFNILKSRLHGCRMTPTFAHRYIHKHVANESDLRFFHTKQHTRKTIDKDNAKMEKPNQIYVVWNFVVYSLWSFVRWQVAQERAICAFWASHTA